jgi:hypothetical protein
MTAFFFYISLSNTTPMKKILLSFLLLVSFVMRSQPFTNGNVYDYSVGDTIVERHEQYNVNSVSNSFPPTFVYRIFTGKSFSAAQDTVFYKTKQISYTPGQGGQNGSIATSTVDLFVTQLNATITVPPINTRTCQTIETTTTSGYCGRGTYITKTKQFTNCFEPPFYKYTYIIGIGGFIDQYSYSPVPGNGYRSVLEKAHKVGQNCDIIGFIPTSVAQLQRTEDIRIFPNPGSGELTVHSENGLTVQLFTLEGQLIHETAVARGSEKVKLNYPAGLYFLKLSDGVNDRCVKYVISY